MKKLITIMINSIKDEFIFGYIPIAIALICGGVSYIFYPDHILATILHSFLIVELGLVLIYKKKQKIENQQLSRAEFFYSGKMMTRFKGIAGYDLHLVDWSTPIFISHMRTSPVQRIFYGLQVISILREAEAGFLPGNLAASMAFPTPRFTADVTSLAIWRCLRGRA